MDYPDKPPSPNQPTVPPSEPEVEQRVYDSAIDKIDDSEELTKIRLPAVLDPLNGVGLDVDSNGFIVHADTREYATPYAFSREAFENIDSPVDNVLTAYFVPATNDDLFISHSDNRLHLTDFHGIIQDETGNPHPVSDDVFMLEKLHSHTGIGFPAITAWSDILDFGVSATHLNEQVSITLSHESESQLTLHCFSPDCGYSGPPSEWEGDDADPECPECGGPWDESITVCTGCQQWHCGTHFEGGGPYAEPSCPNCRADVGMLEMQTRYDEYESTD